MPAISRAGKSAERFAAMCRSLGSAAKEKINGPSASSDSEDSDAGASTPLSSITIEKTMVVFSSPLSPKGMLKQHKSSRMDPIFAPNHTASTDSLASTASRTCDSIRGSKDFSDTSSPSTGMHSFGSRSSNSIFKTGGGSSRPASVKRRVAFSDALVTCVALETSDEEEIIPATVKSANTVQLVTPNSIGGASSGATLSSGGSPTSSAAKVEVFVEL